MKKIYKKSLAIIMVVIMVLASAPLSGFVGLDLPDFGSFKAAAAEEYQSGSYYYTVTDGKATLSGSLGNISGDIVVPSTIDGYPVVALEGTFSGRNVVNVTVPEGITTIGAYSFSRSEKLKSVTFPDGVTSIGYGAFQFCTGLESVRIGEGLVSLDYGAFAVCNSLKEITLPDTVTSIGEYSFIQCYALKTITLPDGITVIPVSAFNECTSLTSIVIPENVTTIDDRAFDDCSALTDVYFKGSKEQWNAISIGDDNDALTNVTVHYHYGKDHDYSIDVVITPPCTSDGVGAKRCTLCGELSETFAIPQTGHFPGEWELKTAATCVEDGEEVKICSQCSE